jgi:recombination protein RecT
VSAQPETGLSKITKDETVNLVMSRVAEFQKSGRLAFPPNYSAENALMSAYLVLQQTLNRDKKPVLQACTRESIANSLLDMVVQGLNPSKKQVYFIAYGPQLVCQRSYFGAMTVAKRVTGAKEIFAEVVYEDDVFKFRIDRGNTIILEHSRELKNIDKAKIVAAYCSVILPDSDVPYTGLMTIAQIHQAWRKSQNHPFDDEGRVKPGSVHGQFAEEMAKKTVTNRTCKMFVNSSMDDSLDLVVHHMNRADDLAEEAEFAEEVRVNANTGEIIDADYTEAGTPEEQPAGSPPEKAAGQQKAAASKRQEPDW